MLKKLWKFRRNRRRKQRVARRRRHFFRGLFKLLGNVVKFGLIFFVATFGLYMFNGENKLIYYVVRPLLNKHYDNQARDRRI